MQIVVTKQGGSGTSINGSVFIYSLTPNTGNITTTMAENNTAVASAIASSDVTEITVGVFAYTGHSHVRPNVKVNGVDVSWSTTANQNPTAYYGTATLTMNTGTITARHEDGAYHRIIVEADPEPVILSAEFTGGYPNNQTEVKYGDNFDIIVNFDPNEAEPTHLEVFNYGACQYDYIDLSTTELNWGTVHHATITTTIRHTGTSQTIQNAKLVSYNINHTQSNIVYTDDNGTVDGTNTLKCNDLYPSFIDNGTVFPNGQTAFKNDEEGKQYTTVNDFDTILYSSPNNDFEFVDDETSYSEFKVILFRNVSHYNDSVTNYRVSATRTANGATSIFNKVIEVANVPPTVTITQPVTRMRTSPAGIYYTITATSDQNLSSAPDIDIPISGTWEGTGFNGGPKVWTRRIILTDGDIGGSGDWSWITIPTNGAGIQAHISGMEVVGGFISRQLTLDPFATTTDLDTCVTDTSKLTMEWSFKPDMVFYPIGTSPPVVNGWTINNTDINPTEVEILDTSAANSSSQESIITIEETI